MTLASIITSLRILANDYQTSNFVLKETPDGSADGTNTKFRLQFRKIVGTSSTVHSVYVSYGTTFRTQSGFTMDLDNGIITFTVAPTNGTAIVADYNYYWFSDTEHTQFLNSAAEQCSETDPTAVPAELQPAMLQYALGYYWQNRASAYANRFSSSSMGLATQVDAVTKNFLELAKLAFDMAAKIRKEYYDRQGQREAPASGVVTYGIDPYTPQR